jgi:BarA-like signal transduction histidine kinase
MAEIPKLDELLTTIMERLQDSIKDTQAAIGCIKAYTSLKNGSLDQAGAQACIVKYMTTGQVPEATPT